MLNNELVSVIVPVFNEKRYLKACVFSILEQTYTNLEILLIDDGSTDGTSEDCDYLASLDNRVRVIHKENQGLSAARLTGLENSVGDWILFVDNDDVISPNLISLLLENVTDEIDIVAGGRADLEEIDYSWFVEKKYRSSVFNGFEVVEMIPEDQQKTIITPLWGKLYRHEFLKKFDLQKYRILCPTIFFEDVLMTPILYSKARKICIVEVVLYIHREVKTSISRSGKLTKFYYEQIESGNILLEYSKSNRLSKYYTYQLRLYLYSILRIYSLAEPEILRIYSSDIKRYYDKYIYNYLLYSSDSLIRKLFIMLFKLNPTIWRILSKKFYFNK